MVERKKVVVLGATGGCVDIVDAIADINKSMSSPIYECVGFLDDNPDLIGTKILDCEVLGPFGQACSFSSEHFFVSGIGSPYNFWRRQKILESVGIPNDRFETIIHPNANVSTHSKIGRGCVLYQFSSVTTNAEIGDHVLVLPNSTVNHDCSIGNHTIITTGVCLSGNVRVGELAYLGSNATIRQDIEIGSRSLIGMGSVVVDNVPRNSVVAGNPAKLVRKTEVHEFDL